MKMLRKRFQSRGFLHEQIKREGRLAIYCRHRIGRPLEQHWEVIKIGRHNGYKLGKSFIEAAETYPSDSMWGRCGWTCTTARRATNKFIELEKYE